MKNQLQASPRPAALPLVRAIARELHERCLRIMILQIILEADHVPRESDRRRQLVAELAANRRALRMARGEMERLGFTIVSMNPLKVRVRECSDPSSPVIELASTPAKSASEKVEIRGGRSEPSTNDG